MMLSHILFWSGLDLDVVRTHKRLFKQVQMARFLIDL